MARLTPCCMSTGWYPVWGTGWHRPSSSVGVAFFAAASAPSGSALGVLTICIAARLTFDIWAIQSSAIHRSHVLKTTMAPQPVPGPLAPLSDSGAGFHGAVVPVRMAALASRVQTALVSIQWPKVLGCEDFMFDDLKHALVHEVEMRFASQPQNGLVHVGHGCPWYAVCHRPRLPGC